MTQLHRIVLAPRGIPKPVTYQRVAAARRAAAMLDAPSSLLVSHGPRMTMYGALALASRFRPRRHLAYSFNFTELPQGPLRAVMRRAFKSVDRFVCFSTMERELYADHFGLELARFDMIHWAARPPAPPAATDASLPADYLCAIGSQGRDYRTLLTAMAHLPEMRLVLVATPESLGGANVPPNVEVRCNIPPAVAMGILQGARFNVVPLLGSEVPCGHVTLVAAMHCGKASIVSDSSGVTDYVQHGVNGLTVPPRDAAALASRIEQLWRDPALALRLGASAHTFARAHCGEPAAVDYLAGYLRTDAAGPRA
ncbi:MAG: glycosyltransferase family 4 protein [Rhizobiales bacterium]|nr:glycosyltransferase family 4 protein [Rhizobacter sp.]